MGPQLADWIARGDVKWEIRHFPLRPETLFAIEAVECAGEQGYWWAMHDQILTNQAKGTATKLMKQYASQMGLDTKAFNQCMDDDRYIAYAKEERAAGDQIGVPGTPSFQLNGQPLSIQSFDDIIKAIEKEMSK